jgi:hypothetical protein
VDKLGAILKKPRFLHCLQTKAGLTRRRNGGVETGAKTGVEGCFMKAVYESGIAPELIAHAPPMARVKTSLPPDSLDTVGRRLRAAYASTLKEPMPVRLTDLLERLGERERSREND